MRVQIGRFGLDPIVDNAAAARRGDNGLTISGIVRTASLADLVTLRAQLNGLRNNADEPVVPVIVDGVANEYWAVSGVSWDEGSGAYDGLFTADWSVDLASIPARAGVLLESRMLMLATGAAPWTAVPTSASGWASTTANATATDRASESGSVRVFSTSQLADATASWRQRPSDAYVGAATLRAGQSGFSVDQTPEPGASSAYWRTPGSRTWTVPTGVNRVRAVVVGGNGGSSINGAAGGRGAQVTCDLDVTPGEVLTINVGGNGNRGGVPPLGSLLGGGAGGFNGGGNGGHVNQTTSPSYRAGGCGGGGASDIRQGGTALANRVIVAGGGGGAATSNRGGNASGVNGSAGTPSPPSGGGGGGTSTAGGIGGGGGAAKGQDGADATGGQGGAGGTLTVGTWAGGGGGGGGYTGGGGGFVQDKTDPTNSIIASGGGAGSSLTTDINATVGVSWASGGSVTLTPVGETGVGDPPEDVAYATIVGRQVDVDPWGWMLTNGIARVRPTYSATEIGFAVQVWTGTNWGVVHRFGIYRWSGSVWQSATAVPVSVVVLRNAPEAVSIRVTYADASATKSHTVDVTLRRGAAWADLTFTSNAGGTWGVVHDPTGTATTIGSGPLAVVANTADVDGSKWFVTGPGVTSGDVDLTAGGARFGGLPESAQVGVTLAAETGVIALAVVARARAVGAETVRAVGS